MNKDGGVRVAELPDVEQFLRNGSRQIVVDEPKDMWSHVSRRIRRDRLRRRTVTVVGILAAVVTVFAAIRLTPLSPRSDHEVSTGTPGRNALTAGLGTSGSNAPALQLPPGFTQEAADTAAKTCTQGVQGGGRPSPGSPEPLLRAAATDSSGSTIVLTVGNALAYCNLAPGGTLDSDWGPHAWSGEAGWLANPIEIESVSSAVADSGAAKAGGTPSGGIQLVVGRAARNITNVVISMPDGRSIKSPVENGIFVARETTPSQPNNSSPEPPPVTARGYDAAGALIATLPFQKTCVVLPNGQVLLQGTTPGQCTTAIAWP